MNVFDQLTPEIILTAVEAQGFVPTGAVLQLGSYENRVYEIALEDREPIVAKFYRPGRWNAATITDEHRFVLAAQELEIPTVAPLPLQSAIHAVPTVAEHAGFFLALYPKFRGREKSEYALDDLRWLGRTLARLHNLGEHFSAPHRMTLTPQTFGSESVAKILALDFIPSAQRTALDMFLPQVVALTERAFAQNFSTITLHGDSHPGNILWNATGPYLLDFDDMVIAPPIQDLWMLLVADPENRAARETALLDGYTTFRKFDTQSLALIEPLRTLRMLRHTAWLADRYDEAIFQRAFPYFTQARYWEEFTQSMREQIGVMQE